MPVDIDDVVSLNELISYLGDGNTLQIADDQLGTYDNSMTNNPYVARLQLELVQDERMEEIDFSELGNYGPKTADAVNDAKDSRAGFVESVLNSGKYVDAEFADTYLVPLMIRQNMPSLNVEQGVEVETGEQPQDISQPMEKTVVAERQ